MRKYKQNYNWQNTQKTEPKHLCANKNCAQEGVYPAPISRYSQKKYQYFCLEHIKEFNKSWNYFEGMDDAQFAFELERMQLGGETWPMGLRHAAEKIHYNGERIRDPFDLFERGADDQQAKMRSAIWPDVSAEETEALALLQLEIPFERPALRHAYRNLARKYHPDSANNQGDTDTIKKINQAYDILKKLLQRYEHV